MNRIGFSMSAVACMLAAGAASGQRFQQVYGTPENPEQAMAVDNTLDGGYVTTGWSTRGFAGGAALTDLLVTRYDNLGNVTWSQRYDNGANERGFSIRTLSDGFIVAGTIDGAPADAQILVTRLDTAGNVVWSRRFAGTAGTDFVNRPDPGVSVVVLANEAGFVVVGNRFGRPSALIISPDGLTFAARDYGFFDPASNFEPDVGVGFTDVVETSPLAELVIVGTARRFTEESPNGDRGVFIMPINTSLDPGGAFVYDTFNPFTGGPVDETGDGIDLDPGRNLLQVAGRFDATPDPDFATRIGPHLFTLTASAPAGPVAWTQYTPGMSATDPFPISWETGYAAVEYDEQSDLIGVGGLWNNPGGTTSGLLEFDGDGGLRGARSYGSDDALGLEPRATAAGEDVVKGRQCGWLVAGRNDLANFIGLPGPFFTGSLGEYLVKTDDALDTGCLQAGIPLAEQQPEFIETFLEVEFADRDEVRDVSLEVIDITPFIDTLCFDEQCEQDEPCPCPGDLDDDGDVDGDDFVLFLVNFGRFYDDQCNVIPAP